MEEIKGAELAVFLKAIEVGDLEKVKQLMPLCRRYFFSYYRQWRTPLLEAIAGGPLSFEILRYFLQQGINPNDVHSDYQRPIYYAILMGHYKCIPLLIEAKANINDIIENGKTALDKCLNDLYRTTPSAIHCLLDNGGKINFLCPEKYAPIWRQRQRCKSAARTLYAVIRRCLRVPAKGYPKGWPLPAALADKMAHHVWSTRQDEELWSLLFCNGSGC